MQDDKAGYFEVLGMVTHLASMSSYRKWRVSTIDCNIVPALKANQCKVYVNDRRKPVAFVTWALVDDECHEALRLSGKNPPSGKWNSGNNLWLIDLVAPFAASDARHVVRDLQRNLFPHVASAYSVRRNPDNSIRRIQVWRNPSVKSG
jgi:cytolysin-activating lysine-acyltransferase